MDFVIQADSDYYSVDSKNVNARLILLVLTISMILSIGITIIRYHTIIDIEISRYELSREDSLWSSDKLPAALADIFILLLQPYPFLNGRGVNI